MKKFIACVRKDLQSDYPLLFFSSAYRRSAKNNRRFLGQAVVYLAVLGLIYLILEKLLGFYDLFAAQGQASVFLAYGLIFFFYFILFFTLPMVVSRLYFSEGSQYSLTLPLTARTVYSSRLLVILLTSLILAGGTMLPVGIKFGVEEQVPLIYYLYLVLGTISFALIVISVFAWLLTVVMRFVIRLPFAKGLMQAIGLTLTLGIVLAMQFAGQPAGSQLNAGYDANEQLILNSAAPILPLIRALPFAGWLLASLNSAGSWAGLFNLLLLLGVAIAVFLLVVFTGSPIYFKGVLSEAKRKKKKTIRTNQTKLFKSHSPIIRLAKIELTDLIKTPIYAFNVVFPGVFLPLVMLFPMLGGTSDLKPEMIRGLLADYLRPNPLTFALAGLTGLLIGILFGSMGNTMVTTITRAKSELWLYQVLPLKLSQQIKGRLIAHLIVVMINSLVISGLIIYFVRPPVLFLILYFPGIFLGGLLMGQIGFLLDLLNPKLSWDSPQQAVKQNLNVLFLTLGALAITAGLVYGTVLLLSKYRIEPQLFLMITAVVILLISLTSVVLYGICKRILRRRLPRFGHS